MTIEKPVLDPMMWTKASSSIQRLLRPMLRTSDSTFYDYPFYFNEVLKNSAISEKKLNELREIFGFDYMGPDFDYKAVSNALIFLIEQNKKKNLNYGMLSFSDNKNIYYICPKEYKDEVISRIDILAKGEENSFESNQIFMMEPCNLDKALNGEEKDVQGWLELDNGYMFFVDSHMFIEVLHAL